MNASFLDRIGAASSATYEATVQLQQLIAAELTAMGQAWTSTMQEAHDLGDRVRALSTVADTYDRELQAFWTTFTTAFGTPRPPRATSVRPLPDDALVRGPGGWAVGEPLRKELSSQLHQARTAIRDGAHRLLRGNYRYKAQESAAAAQKTVNGLRAAAERFTKRQIAVEARARRQAEALRATADERLDQMTSRLAEAVVRLPPAMREWDAASWRSWSPVFSHPLVHLGTLRAQPYAPAGPNSSFGRDARVPFLTSVRSALQLVHQRWNRDQALGLARSAVLRAFASTPPGRLRVSIFDPAGLGQSVASLLELGEYDRDLIGGKVWTSAEDLRRVLAEHTAHIELTIQKYLRAEYETLDEFNAAAGEIAEPYRLLVIVDAPSGFDAGSWNELRRIVENGPRCGVATLLLTDEDTTVPHGVEPTNLPSSVRQIWLNRPFAGPDGPTQLRFDFDAESDASAPSAVVEAIISGVGRGTQETTSSAVSFDRTFTLFERAAAEGRKRGLPRLSGPVDVEDRSTWWSQRTVESVAAPIGLRGARDVATLTFDSSNHAGALLVGRPGSGKSSLLHTFIAGITTMYGPEELELHLVDFKEGVEFKVYAANALPHARTVAIESDREFGVSVLQSLQAEIAWRGSLLRGSDRAHSSLQTLREATGERLPRIVLIFDEFQVLFARNDRLGNQAAEILETLIRQGRGFGVHVLLGSQSLAGLDALGSHVPQLLPVRILLPAADSDAFKVLGEGNPEGAALTAAGEGVLNAAGGAVEANERFRGALIDEETRRTRVAAMRAKADEAGFVRRPLVFEGNAPIPAEETPVERFVDAVRGADAHVLRMRFAAPMTVTGTADVELRREAGANVLLVTRDGGHDSRAFSVPRAVTTNVVLSAVTSGAEVVLIDFLPIDEGIDAVAAPLVDAGAVTLGRRRQVPAVLTRIADEVQARVDQDDTSGPALLLVLYGMHRARDFDQDSVDYDADVDLPETLARIMRDGPEVGVHTFAWFDNVAAIARRLPSSAVREASWRLAGKMSEDDSASFVGVDSASSLREQQLLVVNDDRGFVQRCTTVAQPGPRWTGDLLASVLNRPTEGVR